MEIPLRDVVDILIPDILKAINKTNEYEEIIILLNLFNDIGNYVRLRIEHQSNFGLSPEVALRLFDASVEIAERVNKYVEGNKLD